MRHNFLMINNDECVLLDDVSLYDDAFGSYATPISLFSRGLTPQDFVLRGRGSSPYCTRKSNVYNA